LLVIQKKNTGIIEPSILEKNIRSKKKGYYSNFT